MTATASLVHTIETTIHSTTSYGSAPPLPPTGSSFRSYILKRIGFDAVIAERFYKLLWQKRNSQYYGSFLECCSRATFYRHNVSGLLTVFAKKCHLRWCPICAKQKNLLIAKSLDEALANKTGLRFLTLTLKTTDQPLSTQITTLYDCFKKLRRTKSWQDHVKGGLWFFQVTFDQSKLTFHPHIHCILTGSYFPQPELKALWKSITGDSFVVDIRKINSKKAVYDDVSRYVSRPVQLSAVPECQWLDVYDAFYGRRLCGSFGNLRSISLSGKSTFSAGEYTRVADYNICSNLLGYDGRARYIFYCWQTQRPFPDHVDMLDIEEFIYGVPVHPPPDCESVKTFDPVMF